MNRVTHVVSLLRVVKGAGIATLWLAALPVVSHGAEITGEELAKRLTWATPKKEVIYNGTLQVRTSSGERRETPVRWRAITGDTGWTNVFETIAKGDSQSERIAIAHRPGQQNAYYRSTSPNATTPFSDPKRLHDIMVPFADSDFWVADLGRDFYHWSSQRILREERRRTRQCYVLESRRASEKVKDGYSRVVSWIDQESGGLLRAEAYDAEGEHLKIFSIGSLQKVNGQWHIENIAIRNVQRGSRTEIEFNIVVE